MGIFLFGYYISYHIFFCITRTRRTSRLKCNLSSASKLSSFNKSCVCMCVCVFFFVRCKLLFYTFTMFFWFKWAPQLVCARVSRVFCIYFLFVRDRNQFIVLKVYTDSFSVHRWIEHFPECIFFLLYRSFLYIHHMCITSCQRFFLFAC